MKVLIVNPPNSTGYVKEGRCEQKLSSWQYVMVPISLPYIAAVLREGGFDVDIIDCVAENLSLEELKRQVESFKPRLIILDTTTPTFHEDSRTIDFLKNIDKSILVAAIGVHVTVLADESLKNSKLDVLIRNEPEASCLELAKALDSKSSLKSVLGISYRDGKKIVNNPVRPFIKDLDTMPFPARDLLNNELYTMPIYNRPYTLLVPSRGCPFNCIYCTAHHYYGGRCRERSPENIVDELEEILYKYKIHDVTMWSDTFTFRKGFVMSVCDEILSRGIKINWMCNSRVNTVDLEMLKKMKQAGCSMISYGVESGVQEILDNAKKGITLSQIENAVKWTNEVGIESIAHVIFGLPGETKETISRTIEFVKKINPTYAQFYCAVPFHGTELYEMAKKNNWLITENWDDFEIDNAIIRTGMLSPEDLEDAKIRAFKAFYLRPRYMLRAVKRMKSPSNIVRGARQAISFLKSWVINPRK